jgi:type IV secretion system protein VirB4
MRGDNGRFEMRADEFLPHLGHIKPNVVALEDGSLLAMASMPGLPFELARDGERNSRPHRINSLQQMICRHHVATATMLDGLCDLGHVPYMFCRSRRL